MPSIGPCSERLRNSQSLKRGQQPAQCTEVPPTVLHVHAGRPGKSVATRHDPEVVRSSSHASWPKLGHSSSMKSSGLWWRAGLEDDRLHAALAELVGERAAAGAGADDDHHVASLSSKRGIAHASCSGSGSQSRSLKPRSM